MRLAVYRMEAEIDVDDGPGIRLSSNNSRSSFFRMPPVNDSNFVGMRHEFNSLFKPRDSNRFQSVPDINEPVPNNRSNILPGVESFGTFPRPPINMFPSGNSYGGDTGNNGRKLSDWTMTTVPSRAQSEDMGLAPPAGGLVQDFNQTCCFQAPSESTDNTLLSGRHYPKRLSANDVLNDIPNFPVYPIQNHPTWTSVSGNNARIRSSTPLVSPALAISTISTSGTIVTPLKITEQRYYLLNSLYHTCLHASASYIRSLLPASRLYCEPAREQRRFHPYSRSPDSQPAAQELSLMDNISKICTHIWRKARGDIMAPHRAEAEAVRVMRDLYAWGEIIVRGVDGNDAGEGKSDNGSLCGGRRGVGTNQSAKYGEAAKRFCERLDDAKAWRACQETAGELKQLEDRERGDSVHSGEIE